MEQRKPIPSSGNERPLPPVGENVIVTTPNYRCLAFRDDKGVWRSAIGKQTIEGVTAWEPVDSN